MGHSFGFKHLSQSSPHAESSGATIHLSTHDQEKVEGPCGVLHVCVGEKKNGQKKNSEINCTLRNITNIFFSKINLATTN